MACTHHHKCHINIITNLFKFVIMTLADAMYLILKFTDLTVPSPKRLNLINKLSPTVTI